MGDTTDPDVLSIVYSAATTEDHNVIKEPVDVNQNTAAENVQIQMSAVQQSPSSTSVNKTENYLESEEFAYTKAERFTSEIFKIEVGNLPKFFGFGECKKLLTKRLKLKPHKVHVVKHNQKAYVTFKNEEDKLEAVTKLKGYQYKGKSLEVKNAKPKADAMASKRSLAEVPLDVPASKQKKTDELLTKEEVLKNSVIPWWTKSYEEQLKEKQNGICQNLIDLRKKLGAVPNLDKQIFRWIMQLKKDSGLCCPTKSILPSPVTAGYRNKCGFTIGKNLDGEVDVGFRLGKYRNHTCAVEPPTDLIHVSDQMKKIVASFTDYVRKSKLTVYDRQKHEGHWKQLVLRTSRRDMVMAIIALCKQKLSREELKQEQESIKNHFKMNKINVDSLLFRVILDESISSIDATPASVFDGEGVIYENLFDLKFRISPDAFFQCNTLGAEVLYDCVKNMVLKKVINRYEFSDTEKDEDIILLDICCGTGTIGLSLAQHVKKVIGVDICKEAIEDAKINAELNEIANAEFRCNKAEEEFPILVRELSLTNDAVVAVVDPPRCGLHHTVIKGIRQCAVIQKLVYVSCSIDQAKQNFVDLCRPVSKRFQGLPFLPVLAQPIDLFPHTAHCELVVLLERIDEDDAANVSDQKTVSQNCTGETALLTDANVSPIEVTTNDFCFDSLAQSSKTSSN